MGIRQVVREAGTFNADVDEDGSHADGFSAIAHSLHSLISQGGPAEASAAAVGNYGLPTPGRRVRNPFARLFETKGAKIHV